ncbi:uncharacterized protein METZ01_LOCUS272883 [marine metagenome]|uniref:Uncharacterized protein n=1 Tax=marine metagenome TaxID=408172 RepID=A0A382K765_9ZZZZ
MKYIKKAPKQEFSNFGTFLGAGRTPKRMNVSLRTLTLKGKKL